MNIFGKRLKEALKNKNMTAIELANKLDINRGIISNYINGKYKPKQDRITQIARILNVKESWLMGFDDIVQDPKSFFDEVEDSIKDSTLSFEDKKGRFFGCALCRQAIRLRHARRNRCLFRGIRCKRF